MGEQGLRIPDYYPEVGRAIAITNIKSLVERVATVTKISSKETWLKLSRTTPFPFKEQDRVRMKHWNKGDIYCWGEEILNVTSPKEMAISRRSEKATIERRKSFRLHSEIPLSLTVLNAAESQLSEKVFSLKTQNISEGGLAFETELLLKVGDELQVNFSLTSSQQVSTEAWVVRSKLGNLGLHSIGVEFLGLKRSVQHQIKQFLEAGEQIPLSKEERRTLVQQRDSLRNKLEFSQTIPIEQNTHSFEVGQSVFLQGGTKQEHLAEVVQVSDSEIGMELSESRRLFARTDSQFQCQTGDSLLLRSWDEKALYYYEVEVVKFSKESQSLSISRIKPGMTLQRRRTLRTDLEVPFSFTVLDASQGQLVTDEVHEAKTENISLTGLGFESKFPLREGDEILVTLPMISIGEFIVSGRVVWTQRKSGTHLFSIGVQLRQLTPEEQDRLLQFMKSVKS